MLRAMIIGGNLGGGGAGRPPASGPSDVVSVTEREFEGEVLRSEFPVLIEFVSERSEACRAIAPEVEALAREMKGKLKVVKVDAERSPVIAQQLRVQQVPTFMVFAEGRIVDAQAGALRKKQLQAMVDPFLPRAEGAIKAPELAQLIPTGQVSPIDTRDAGAFARAHIPGAKHMALEEIESRLAELYMFAGRPVLYCRSGDKSKELAARLAEQGVPVAFLEGGLLGWEAERFPIERS